MKRLFQQLWLIGISVGALIVLVPRLGVVPVVTLFIVGPLASLAVGRWLFNPGERAVGETVSSAPPDVAAVEARLREFFADMRQQDELAMERHPPSLPPG